MAVGYFWHNRKVPSYKILTQDIHKKLRVEMFEIRLIYFPDPNHGLIINISVYSAFQKSILRCFLYTVIQAIGYMLNSSILIRDNAFLDIDSESCLVILFSFLSSELCPFFSVFRCLVSRVPSSTAFTCPCPSRERGRQPACH